MMQNNDSEVAISENRVSGLNHDWLNNTEFAVNPTTRQNRQLEYRRLMYKRWYAIRRHVPFSHRIRACHTMLNPSKQALDVQVNAKKRVRIVGHVHCDNVWLCPLCSNKRAISHAGKLNLLLQYAIDNNLSVYFVTFTLRHTPHNKLIDTYNALKGSMRSMKKSSKFLFMLDDNFIEPSSVTFTEITYTDNGFHPHFHCLYLAHDGYGGSFDDNGMNAITREYELKAWELAREKREKKLQREFYSYWQKELKKRGFWASEEKGVHVRLGDSAVKAVVSYLNDEGVHETKEVATGNVTPNRAAVSELTSHATKNPKQGGINPFDLLPDKPYAFDEYIAGTKGKQRVSGLDDIMKKFDIDTSGNNAIDESERYTTLFTLSIERYRTLIDQERVADFIEFVESSLAESEE